ncbi:MAG: hypothetical protein P3W84_000305 [Thermodesulfobacteriaceae bacterium]|nr:hypothetical protein [Thermodesulfobacteriaceae bacterium]
MKRILSLFIGIFMVGSASSLFAVESCVKCHKSMDKVAELIKRSGAKSEDELVDFLRSKSPKKALHQSLSDEEIKKAFITLSSEKRNRKDIKNYKKERKSSNATRANATKSNCTEANATKKTNPVREIPATKKKIEGC